MSSTMSRLLLLAAAASPAFAFCGSHTHLQARAEEGGAVPISKFGYFGTQVRLLVLLPTTHWHDINHGHRAP